MAKGMIVAPQPEAVEAGAEVFEQGGNAVDAAMACALVQGVVDPQMTGIAGFGSMQVYLPGRDLHTCIDFHGRAPAAVRPEMWQDLIVGEARDGFGFILAGNVNDMGYQSITVPGSLKAYAEAQAAWGRLPWADVVAPAIDYADNGFMIRPAMTHFWTEDDGSGRVVSVERLRLTESGRRIYFHPDGALRRTGEILTNPELARTLRRIAEAGAEDFYGGDIAAEIAADMAANDGLLSAQDLSDYRTSHHQPLLGDYRGNRVATNQPPGGGVMLLEMLNILEQFDLAGIGHNSAEYVRTVAEAMKRATADKDEFVGDPNFVDVPLERLTGKAHAATYAEAIKRGEVAHVERLSGPAESANTTHLSAVDGEGNAVSMTHSLGMPSGVITPGLGFMYNGCMGVFDPRPGRAGSLAPGKGRFSSMCPSIVFRDDRPILVLGAPGGTQIAMGVLQVMLNVLDFAMPVLEAVTAPRFSATSDVIDISNRIPRFVSRRLEEQGYEICRSPYSYPLASVHAIRIDGEVWSGGADPNRDGMALLVP
ncbi:MAG: gamma-glutamyltransferase [Alphaproteobacteria bacterium]|jgi:gamma-glutamyltranspeptidase/glutathione hydrolase|nr:gamma-glutamyltransferase [Alphaproteobacteria bacterium]MDP6565146.1 gamma-glutamyltransferase [Alphaproteobacteria bacterium]